MIQRLALPLTGLSALTFAALSALRRKRIFHPIGVAYFGTIQLFAPKGLPLPKGTHPVIARFSRGAGAPEPLPDVLGFAIKVMSGNEREQDLLLASSGSAPGTRNLLLPAKSFFRATYSSVLAYSARGERVLFGARADSRLRDTPGDLAGLKRAASEGNLRFALNSLKVHARLHGKVE